ncbi:MAG: phosphoribosylamine--glycine ligase [Ignavibacteria bacterium]|nr:phosphoribosylamine--glycine ligase [Ignavibacteria bacterium]
MKILLIGSGGRENALAWKISTSKSFTESESELICAPGNPGIARFAKCIDIKTDDTDAVCSYAKEAGIELVVVGPEVPLALGLADKLRSSGLLVFGPGKNAAEIESSKIFAKELMIKHGIPTARFRRFGRQEEENAKSFIRDSGLPLVFKADGLASGKGVIIAETTSEAESALAEMVSEDSFGSASDKFIIEEYLTGEEVSVFCITDGDDFVLLPFSQDHKRAGEGETGKNTGGMGAIAPVKKFMSAELEKKISVKIIEPVLRAMRDEGRKFSGCLYCGLMICDGEPFVVEFNCRFGDPETQSVLPLISSDFLGLLIASASGKLRQYELETNGLYSCCVVAASGGYPGEFRKGAGIHGLDQAEEIALVFHSGTMVEGGELKTSGGRVLSVVGLSEHSIDDAAKKAYEAVSRIGFDSMYFRKDIGWRLRAKENSQ